MTTRRRPLVLFATVVVCLCGLARPAPADITDDLALSPDPDAVASLRTRGWILLGTGALALGVGIWAGVEALDIADEAAKDCGEHPYSRVCGPTGIRLRKRARSWATLSTFGVVAGPPLLLIGALVSAVAPGATDRIIVPRDKAGVGLHASALPGGAYLGLRGRF